MSEDIRLNNKNEIAEFFENQKEHHIYWKNKVESFFANPAKDHVLPALLSDDHHCQLGYWINSEQSQDYSELTAFKKIREIHTKFHQTADKIMVLIMEGETTQAEILKQSYLQLSDQIIECLDQLNNT